MHSSGCVRVCPSPLPSLPLPLLCSAVANLSLSGRTAAGSKAAQAEDAAQSGRKGGERISQPPVH
jgi:hypothetical protein